ncbi:MAG: c-type cytochrome [Polyangiaceae bacterium]
MRFETRVIYRYVLWALSLTMAAFAIARIHGEPALKKGSITTRWREGGDVVERCTSCHTEPHPASQDALLALHPTAQFGCISCHGGNASRTDLGAHDGLLSVKKDEGMLSDAKLVEAGCGRCHASEKKLTLKDGVDLAPHLSHGRALFEAKCAACHDPDASHDRALPLRWLSAAANPTAFMAALTSPSKGMPIFFGNDAEGKAARKNILAWLTSLAPPTDVRGVANVPGASADEGKEIFDAYGCKSCHAAGLAEFTGKNREDFIAFYMQNPARVRPHDAMPSFRLTVREAASVAKFVSAAASPAADDADANDAATPAYRDAREKCSAANDVQVSHAECGAKLAAKLGCASCHSDEKTPISKAPPRGTGSLRSDFTAWGAIAPTLDRLRITTMWLAPPSHPDTQTDIADIPDLLVALASKMDAHVTADFDPARAPYFEKVRGDELLEARGCMTCHQRASRDSRVMGAADEPRGRVPSLLGEGAHVQPQWLLAFLRDPQANAVRASLHPEWVWGELVPPQKMAVRMPNYDLSNDDATAIVRALAIEDGGEFPYADVRVPALSSNEILSALVHVNGSADNGGACFTCHYLGALPVDRAKTNLDGIAPDLGRVWQRLRPWFVADLLAKPQDFVVGMPALWPDALATNAAPLAWTIPADALPKKNAVDQIMMTRNFLFLLRDATRLPRVGEELKTPILGLAVSSSDPAPPHPLR